jgi:sugar-specific transcriptional regulator TrmB
MLQSEIILKKLGLSEHESRVYLLGLKLGPSLASEISKQSGLGRTLVYHLLGQLKSKGLASEQGLGNGKKFFMEPSERLLDIVERKQKELEGMAVQISQITKELKSSAAIFPSMPQIRVYEGTEGIKNFAQETFATQKMLLKSIVPIAHLLKMFDKYFLRYWFLGRNRNNITGKTLFTGTPDKPFSLDQIKQLLDTPYASSFLHQWKKSPKELAFPNIIVIFGNKVAVVSSPEKPSVFVIDSGEFAGTMNTLFDDVWRRSTALKLR